VRLQRCAIRISTCSYGRGRYILLLDVDDRRLLSLFRLTDCVRNRHSADDCENADTQTVFHDCPPKIAKAIKLPRVALLSPWLELDRSILLKRLVSPARRTDNIRRGRSERVALRENPAMVVLGETASRRVGQLSTGGGTPFRLWCGVQRSTAVGIRIAIGAVDVGCNTVLDTRCSSALERRKRRWTATTCFFVE
jgi:hypothetical protein